MHTFNQKKKKEKKEMSIQMHNIILIITSIILETHKSLCPKPLCLPSLLPSLPSLLPGSCESRALFIYLIPPSMEHRSLAVWLLCQRSWGWAGWLPG